ncbi:hypothetical protein V8E36_002177 [Tilletia maclaganii]
MVQHLVGVARSRYSITAGRKHTRLGGIWGLRVGTSIRRDHGRPGGQKHRSSHGGCGAGWPAAADVGHGAPCCPWWHSIRFQIPHGAPRPGAGSDSHPVAAVRTEPKELKIRRDLFGPIFNIQPALGEDELAMRVYGLYEETVRLRKELNEAGTKASATSARLEAGDQAEESSKHDEAGEQAQESSEHEKAGEQAEASAELSFPSPVEAATKRALTFAVDTVSGWRIRAELFPELSPQEYKAVVASLNAQGFLRRDHDKHYSLHLRWADFQSPNLVVRLPCFVPLSLFLTPSPS